MIESSTIIGLVVVAEFLDGNKYFYAGNGTWFQIGDTKQTNLHYMSEHDANDAVKKFEHKANIVSISVCMHAGLRKSQRGFHDVLIDPVGVMNNLMPASAV